MERYDTLGWIGWGLATIGALNWGLSGAANLNLVHSLFGRNPNLERAVYVMVGISGLFSIFRLVEHLQGKSTRSHGIMGRLRRAA